MPALTRSGMLDEAHQREVVERFIKEIGIKCSGPNQKIRELSGGNQQKVLLARWLCMNPKLLILDEPTRGIDVGAKAEIQNLIRRLANDGLGVLMISSELEEIVEGADRVFVLREGAPWRNSTTRASPKAKSCMPWRTGTTHDGESQRKKAMPRRFDRAAFFQRYGVGIGAHPAHRLQSHRHAELCDGPDAGREPHAGLHHRHRRRRHDAGHCHGRHRSVGRLADGDCRCPVAHVLHGPADTRCPISMWASRSASSSRSLIAGLFGLFNGWLITKFKIQPIIATLVLFIAGRGIAQVSTNGDLQVFKVPEFQAIAIGRVLGVPFQVWIMLAIVIVAAFVLHRTVFGRQVLAVGGNEAAARLSGIPVNRIKFLVYMICGMCSGVAGLIVIAMNSAADANLIGLGMELDAIAAVVVGGTLLSGGRATIIGTLLGALVIQLVRYTLLANGVPDPAALVVKAGLIVLAVWLQRQEQA